MAVHGVKKSDEMGGELHPSTDSTKRVPKDRMADDRQGRVPAEGGDRAALRQHPRRPVERAGRHGLHRHLDHGIERGVHARGHGTAAGLARAPPCRGQANRHAQHRHGRQRPGLLAQVRPLLGRRAAPRARRGRELRPDRPGGRGALRREHDRRRGRSRLDLHGRVRADRRDQRGPGRPPGADGPRHPDPRRRRERRVRRTVHPAGPRVGLPAAAGQVDQRVGAQVRPRAARRGLDPLARRRRPAGGAGLPRELPRRRHAGLRHQLLAARQPGDRPVLQLRAAGALGLPPDPAERPGRGPPPRRRDRGHGAVPDAHARDGPAGALVGDEGRRQLHGARALRRPARLRLAGPGLHDAGEPHRPGDLPHVVRHGLRWDLADLLLDDMRTVLERFAADPDRSPSTNVHTGFSHT